MNKFFLWSLSVLLSLIMLAFLGCDSDDDVESSATNDNPCTGSCLYCEDKPGQFCTGSTEDSSGDTWCWYCYDGQTCNPDTGHCE